MSKKFWLLALGIFAFNVSCTSIGRMLRMHDDPETKAVSNAPVLYQKAMQQLDAKAFEESYQTLTDFISNEPSSPWLQVALYNRGRAAEGLKDWNRALENYEIVVRTSQRDAPKLQAMAMFRLVTVYEELGRDDRLIATATDLRMRRNLLSPIEAEAELPARMASAYARKGEVEAAEEYFQLTEKAIYRFRILEKSSSVEWLARTFLAMGRSVHGTPDWNNVEAFIAPVQRGQKYLMQAVELESAPWSVQAADEAISVYEALWSAIQLAPDAAASEDEIIDRRQKVRRQADLAIDIYEGILDLDRLRTATDPGVAGQKLLGFIQAFRKRTEILLEASRLGNDLTEAEQKRIYEVKGRTVDPNPILERKSKK